MSQQLDEIEQTAKTILTALQRRVDPAAGKNVNTMRIEGAGSMWNGIAIGIALGAVIAGSAWMAYRMQEMDIRTRQAEAYKAAVYMLAPRFAEEIDKELQRRSDDKKEAGKP
jgi:hypothetical protein